MSINTHEIITTILADMRKSERLTPDIASYLHDQEELIKGTIKQHNTNRAISLFLETIFEAQRAQGDWTYEKTNKLIHMMGKNSSIDSSRRLGDNILIALRDVQFKDAFLDIFSSQTPFSQPLNFPHLSANQGNMDNLDQLLQFCSTAESGLLDYVKPVDPNAKEETSCCSPIGTIVLGAFITALGITAVALALTVLIAAPPALFAVALSTGIAAIIGGATTSGFGFFKLAALQEKEIDNSNGYILTNAKP